MINLIINVIFILFIVTVIWDISGYITDITRIIYEKTHKGKKWMGQQLTKLISCSYCVKFHCVWIYLIIFCDQNIILGLFITCVSTFFGQLLKKILIKINNLLN